MTKEVEPFPSDQILKICEDNWGLANLAFVRKMENIVFRGQRGADTCYLRLTTPLRRSKEEIEAELDWIEYLSQAGLPVVSFLQDRKGRRLLSIDEGGCHYEAAVCLEMGGTHPSEAQATDPAFLRALGAEIAQMHNAAERYELQYPLHRREEWGEERGIRHAVEAARSTKDTEMKEHLAAAIDCLRGYSTDSPQYGLVHTDLGAANLFVQNDGSIGIIDFDDSCYHWFAFDLAIVLYSMANRFNLSAASQELALWQSALLTGYRQHRGLDEEEQIPSFMDYACLRLYFWIEHHQNLNTFTAESMEKVLQMKDWARRWVTGLRSKIIS